VLVETLNTARSIDPQNSFSCRSSRYTQLWGMCIRPLSGKKCCAVSVHSCLQQMAWLMVSVKTNRLGFKLIKILLHGYNYNVAAGCSGDERHRCVVCAVSMSKPAADFIADARTIHSLTASDYWVTCSAAVTQSAVKYRRQCRDTVDRYLGVSAHRIQRQLAPSLDKDRCGGSIRCW